MTMPKVITELYAWVVTEDDGSEGIAAVTIGAMFMPLVGADRERIESYRDHARLVQRETGCRVRLMRFSTASLLEELADA